MTLVSHWKKGEVSGQMVESYGKEIEFELYETESVYDRVYTVSGWKGDSAANRVRQTQRRADE